MLLDCVSTVVHHPVLHAKLDFVSTFFLWVLFRGEECFTGHLFGGCCQSEKRQSGRAPRRLVLKHSKTKTKQNQNDDVCTHTKFETRCTVSQEVRITPLVIHASNLERKKSGKARQLDRQVLFWDVDLNSGDDERASILCPAAHLHCHGACKKNKGGGRTSIHCNVDPCSAEILLETVVSVNLFRIS